MEDIEKNEYEIALYGFTLDNFKQENFQFVENQIHHAMKSLNLTKLIQNTKPETQDKISKICKTVEKNIQASCSEKIEKNINEKVDKLLQIPDNVLLHNDRLHMREKSSTIEELEQECEELMKTFKENVLFINLLENECNMYDKLNLDSEENVTDTVEQNLNIHFDTDFLLNNVNK